MLLEVLIKKVMGNHAYSFNGINKLQLEGGPIGLKLSGAIAKIVMLEQEVHGDNFSSTEQLHQL